LIDRHLFVKRGRIKLQLRTSKGTFFQQSPNFLSKMISPDEGREKNRTLFSMFFMEKELKSSNLIKPFFNKD